MQKFIDKKKNMDIIKIIFSIVSVYSARHVNHIIDINNLIIKKKKTKKNTLEK